MRYDSRIAKSAVASKTHPSVLYLLFLLGFGALCLVFAMGCARSSARVASAAWAPAPAAYAPSDLVGSWRGSFGQIGASIYADDGNCLLEIKDDGTFTEQVSPLPGANNLAKASTWSGTVVQRGDRVTLRTAQGPSLTLVRSGSELYGVAEDPLVEATIAIRFEREAISG